MTREISDVAGPAPRAMLADIRWMLRDAPGYLLHVSEQYPGVASFPLPRTPVLFVNDPAGVRRVLVDNHRAYCKRTVQYDTLALLTGQGLLVSDPPRWRRNRRLVQPAFHHSGLAAVVDHAAHASGLVLDSVLPGPAFPDSAFPDSAFPGSAFPGSAFPGSAFPDSAFPDPSSSDQALPHPGAARVGPLEPREVDVDALMMRATLQVVGEALFSTDLSGAAGRLVALVLEALEQVVVRARTPWRLPLVVPTPGNRRLRRGLTELDRSVQRMLADRRARPRAAGPLSSATSTGAAATPDGGPDVLDLLLAGYEGEALTDAEVRDEIVTLLIAGHETVASSLTWTLHLLSQHPEVARRLEVEVDGVVGPGEAPSWSDLASLPLTRAVIDEALRLYPPAWVISRRALEADVVAGISIPAGTLILLSPYVLHRNPDRWPDPERFEPERWLAAPPASDSYLPFGAGPRLCIGRDFALVESVVLLAGFIRRFRVVPVPGRRVVMDALVTLRPRDGLPLLLTRR